MENMSLQQPPHLFKVLPRTCLDPSPIPSSSWTSIPPNLRTPKKVARVSPLSRTEEGATRESNHATFLSFSNHTYISLILQHFSSFLKIYFFLD